MFTGIVEHRGRVTAAGDGRLRLTAGRVAEDAELGASVSVNGVCLTVAELDGEELGFDLAPETLERSTLGELKIGDTVNLERPLTLATPLGGHLVQGHVDGVGRVAGVEESGDGARMRIEPSNGLGRYLVEKGSVAIDGVSLTVASMDKSDFEVALVPHTLEATTLGEKEQGSLVNIEVDILAKYVEKLTRRDR